MPAPERTTAAAIVDAGRAIVEAHGLDALTMQAVADRVGVRAPSLYKRIAGRDALLAAVVAAVLDDLEAAIAAAASDATPRERLAAIAAATRAFAHRHPVGYGLVFAPAPAPAAQPDVGRLGDAAAPLLAATHELVGEAAALDAARLLTAWLHGFLAMELGGAFRLDGDVDRAFAYGLRRILDAIDA
ncbi:MULTISPECIES: TetR/AcrR family transcriptional regulator [unclassified Agrococcus]|uniref:TetR/AcrR family transcriptional regulator n=1 Tax=unclassified Agrococcus TaxID=2615065 RepID=UPI003618E93B